MTISVVVIGASFAKAAYLPALATVPDAQVVAIASARLESAKSTAEAFKIPHAYDGLAHHAGVAPSRSGVCGSAAAVPCRGDSGGIGQRGAGDPASRPAHNWWLMANMGGGKLGANGSHQIDLLRFWLGDIEAVSGQVTTLVPNRKDKQTGEPWTATADDEVSFTATMKNGTLASVFMSSAARHSPGNTVQIFGSEGSIRLAK